MDELTIAPRYADKARTIPMPNARNVYYHGDQYIGQIVWHDGAWTPLFSTADTENTATVDALTRAAAQMNAVEADG